MPYCQYCGEEHSTEEDVLVHQERAHNVCSSCGKDFESQDALQLHRERGHQDPEGSTASFNWKKWGLVAVIGFVILAGVFLVIDSYGETTPRQAEVRQAEPQSLTITEVQNRLRSAVSGDLSFEREQDACETTNDIIVPNCAAVWIHGPESTGDHPFPVLIAETGSVTFSSVYSTIRRKANQQDPQISVTNTTLAGGRAIIIDSPPDTYAQGAIYAFQCSEQHWLQVIDRDSDQPSPDNPAETLMNACRQ